MDIWTAGTWVGKIIFCLFFFSSGLNHFTRMQAVIAYAQAKKVPLSGLLVPLSGLMLMGGAVMILLRWHQIWAFTLIGGFLVPAAFLVHNFWAEADPMQRANQRAHFGKNLGLAAAALLLAVMVHRGGPL